MDLEGLASDMYGYVRLLRNKRSGWGIKLPDRELACAPLQVGRARIFCGYAAALILHGQIVML